jgi:hypothetical protein
MATRASHTDGASLGHEGVRPADAYTPAARRRSALIRPARTPDPACPRTRPPKQRRHGTCADFVHGHGQRPPLNIAEPVILEQACRAVDGRGAWVALTDRGRNAIEDAAPPHVAHVRRYFIDALTPEQLDALSETCAAILHKIEESQSAVGCSRASSRAKRLGPGRADRLAVRRRNVVPRHFYGLSCACYPTTSSSSGNDVVVGPGSMIHGCHIGARSIVEVIGALVCDWSRVGHGSVIRAGSCVKQRSEFPALAVLVASRPGRSGSLEAPRGRLDSGPPGAGRPALAFSGGATFAWPLT